MLPGFKGFDKEIGFRVWVGKAGLSIVLVSGARSLRSAAEERAMNNVVANAMAEAFNPRSSDALRSAADGVLKVKPYWSKLPNQAP